MHAHRLLAAQQRRLVVQRLTGHRDEHRRDAQRVAVRVFQDVGGAGDVPAGVAACLEGAPQPARGEAGGVGLALDQGFAGELGECLPVGDGLQEAVVLLSGEAGHRVEHVGVVGGALLQRPVLHGHRDRVGDRGVELGAFIDRRHDGLVDRLGQPCLHLGLGKDVGAEDLAGGFTSDETDGRGDVCLDVVDRLQADCVSAQLSSYRYDEGVRGFRTEAGPPHCRRLRWQTCYARVNVRTTTVSNVGYRPAWVASASYVPIS